MTRLLVAVASLGFALSNAGACGINHSAHAGIDNTVVASVPADESQQMSTPQKDNSESSASISVPEQSEE